MKNEKQKEMVLEQLKKYPIVQVACEKTGVSRATYYRWKTEDKLFKDATEKALADGEALITDMGESQLITLIRNQNFPAIQLWLKHHHPKYSNKVELSGRLTVESEPLTPAQEALIARALEFAGIGGETNEPKPTPEGNASRSS